MGRVKGKIMIENKKYYIDLINSSKANKFTCRWHYSGVGFKKAKINQGIFRKEDDLLVGVLQWGISAQENIRLDRYVNKPITKDEYLELNRFCMADSEGKNSESQAISLGIKWIKRYRPEIRLLVSYAGRKEGNYGYIYQATNWNYLGYFVSDGFWIVDGQEKHQITLWNNYRRHADQSLGFKKGVCQLYHDVKQTWTKQFIYIKVLDDALTSKPILPYPKPSTDYPICTRVEVHQENKEYENWKNSNTDDVIYYWEKDEQLFSRAAMIRRGEIVRDNYAVYDTQGDLVFTSLLSKDAAEFCGIAQPTLKKALNDKKNRNGYFIKTFKENESPLDKIEINDYVAIIDGHKFFNQSEIAEYCGVSRQAVSGSKQRKSKNINGHEIEWR